MTAFRRAHTIALVAFAVLVTGCGTPREKTAPCTRPANVTSYAAAQSDCGPMTALNTHRATALAAIKQLADDIQE